MNFEELWIGPVKPLSVLTASEVFLILLNLIVIKVKYSVSPDRKKYLFLLHSDDGGNVIGCINGIKNE